MNTAALNFPHALTNFDFFAQLSHDKWWQRLFLSNNCHNGIDEKIKDNFDDKDKSMIFLLSHWQQERKVLNTCYWRIYNNHDDDDDDGWCAYVNHHDHQDKKWSQWSQATIKPTTSHLLSFHLAMQHHHRNSHSQSLLHCQIDNVNVLWLTVQPHTQKKFSSCSKKTWWYMLANVLFGNTWRLHGS